MKLLLLREPLLQFLLLGAVLFALFGIFGKKDEAEVPAKIVVSVARIATLADGFARTWGRPPTEQELQGLVDGYIRDEVFYREGRAAGLDRDDVIIRRRVRQKMEFLAEEAAADPSEEQLAAYLASNPERFRTEDRLTFHHVFLSAARRGGALEEDAKQIAATLVHTNASAEAATTIGDPFLLGETFPQMPQSEVVRTFGEGFAKQLATVEPGRWQGPISSSFGAHFIFADERARGSSPPLDIVRQAVQREWLNARRVESEEKHYRTLRDRYQIVVEAPPKGASSETAK